MLGDRHREWADGLGLFGRDGTEFDTSRIVPYAYRHTYAQRHACRSKCSPNFLITAI
jgi:hypothetical protein